MITRLLPPYDITTLTTTSIRVTTLVILVILIILITLTNSKLPLLHIIPPLLPSHIVNIFKGYILLIIQFVRSILCFWLLSFWIILVLLLLLIVNYSQLFLFLLYLLLFSYSFIVWDVMIGKYWHYFFIFAFNVSLNWIQFIPSIILLAFVQ